MLVAAEDEINLAQEGDADSLLPSPYLSLYGPPRGEADA